MRVYDNYLIIALYFLVQGTADVGAQYVSGAVPHGHYDMQQHHVHR